MLLIWFQGLDRARLNRRALTGSHRPQLIEFQDFGCQARRCYNHLRRGHPTPFERVHFPDWIACQPRTRERSPAESLPSARVFPGCGHRLEIPGRARPRERLRFPVRELVLETLDLAGRDGSLKIGASSRAGLPDSIPRLVTPGLGVKTFGCCRNKARNSSSRSLSRNQVREAIDARPHQPLASSRSKT